MPRAVFNFFWDGGFRPVIIELGETLHFDTGRVMDGEDWHRCQATLCYNGNIVAMSRLTEISVGDSVTTSIGKWTCTPQHLNHDTRDLGSVTVITPAWVDAEADYCGNIANTNAP